MEQPFLYHYLLSFESQLARLALAEKGVAWQGRTVDIGPAHQNYQPWFISISADGEVPVLLHDNERIKGGLGVAKYVNRHFAGPELIPRNPWEESVCASWVKKVEQFPVQPFSYAVARGGLGWVARNTYQRGLRLLKKYRKKAKRSDERELMAAYDRLLDKLGRWRLAIVDPGKISELTARLQSLLDELEQQLADRQWLAGSFSLADLVWAAFLARLDLLGFDQEWRKGRRPAVANYYRQLRKRPTFRQARLCRRVPIFSVLPGLLRGYWRSAAACCAVLLVGLAMLIWPG